MPMPTVIADASLVLAILGLPGGAEWIILLVLGLLIFGRRLPEVGRSLGKGIVEFKKGIRGIEDEIDEESSRSSNGGSSSRRIENPPRQELPRSDQREHASAAIDRDEPAH